MPFVVFTLALVLNNHVHLISVADEPGGLHIGDGTRAHVQNLKMENRLQDGREARRSCSEVSVWPACQHGWWLAAGTAMSHTPTAAVHCHTPLRHAELLLYSGRRVGSCHISHCCKIINGMKDGRLEERSLWLTKKIFPFLTFHKRIHDGNVEKALIE